MLIYRLMKEKGFTGIGRQEFRKQALGLVPEVLMPESAGYLAGIIDGEGCISLYRHKDPGAKTGFGYNPTMSITANDLWFLRSLRTKYGGYVAKVANRHSLVNMVGSYVSVPMKCGRSFRRLFHS